MQRYAVTRIPTPVLNTPEFATVFGGKDGVTLKTDRCGMPRALEFIALPGTLFSIISELHSSSSTVYQVITTEYPVPPGTRLYLDSRFIETKDATPLERRKKLPEKEEILSALRSSVGNPYIWGGNVSAGIPELNSWFYRETTTKIMGGKSTSARTLAGLDCSGLLYQTTFGWTPRNTSQLVDFGNGLKIKGKSADEITMMLEPLDLIVWNGHVVIVLDQETAIESRLECGKTSGGGVIMSPLKERVAGVMKTRKPANQWSEKDSLHSSFVVRRWYKNQLQQ